MSAVAMYWIILPIYLIQDRVLPMSLGMRWLNVCNKNSASVPINLLCVLVKFVFGSFGSMDVLVNWQSDLN